ncbi:MAG: flippase [Syntrophus sp. (in: bacteria)]
MSLYVNITKWALIRNAFMNLVGQVIPMFVVFFTLPYVVDGLGVMRYGIFSLVRVIIDYFSVFDIGMGIATTRFTADAIGRGETKKVVQIFWTSLSVVFLVGLAATLLFLTVSPLLMKYVFAVEPDMIEEMQKVFMIASPLILALLVRSVSIGVLQAYQRFDLVNFVQIPYLIMAALIPVVVIYCGYGLPIVIFWMVIMELIIMVIWLIISYGVIPRKKIFFLDILSLKKMIAFGGLLAIQRLTNGVVFNIHSVIVGSLISLAAITYYNVPWNLTSKVGLVGASITPIIFPLVSLFHGVNEEKSSVLLSNSLKYFMLLYGLPCLVLILFAKDILVFWMGTDFTKSILVMQIMALGIFFAGVSWVFSTFLQVYNPKLITLITIIQAPFHVLMTWILTVKFGITGTACAWALLCVLSALVGCTYFVKIKVLKISKKPSLTVTKGLASIFLVVGVIILLKHLMIFSLFSAGVNILILTTGYAIIAWQYFVLEEHKRELIVKINCWRS